MYKTMLQEMCQKRRWRLPEYSTLRDGPSHNASFTATVTVNGLAFSTPHPCRSNKEAQNLAANVAYAALTAEIQHQQAAATEFHPQPQGVLNFANGVNEERAGGEGMERTDDPIPEGIQHMYKNKLQQYAQKNNMAFPVYKNEFKGPPHCRVFRSTVSLCEKEYKADAYFTTLREAEQAAAQKACQDLLVDLNQEDASLYKNLLQELTQKRGFVFPTYETSSSGPSHNMTFASAVEVEGCKFIGPEAKNKKQAEAMAARVAYLALTKAAPTQSMDQPIALDVSQQVVLTPPATNACPENNEVYDSVSEAKNQIEEPSIQTTTARPSSQTPDASIPSGDSSSGYYQLQSPADARPAEIITNGENSKTLIVRRGSNYQIPTGAVVKKCDEEWVAYEIVG